MKRLLLVLALGLVICACNRSDKEQPTAGAPAQSNAGAPAQSNAGAPAQPNAALREQPTALPIERPPPLAADRPGAVAPITPAEREIVEHAFCVAVGDDPNRTVEGIGPTVNAAIEGAGIEHTRAVFITEQWFTEFSDHKIPTVCGKPVDTEPPASEATP
jgi:hypothetical protein